jgi:threonine dehydrogenase-like Zn-dependent dehydrogenase
MIALLCTEPRETELVTLPDPAPQRGEVLVAVEAAAIAGTDLAAWRGLDPERRPPLVLGREAAGRIVRGPRTGERVAVDPLLPCGDCAFCRTGRPSLCRSRRPIATPQRLGAFAGMVRVPGANAVGLPDDCGMVRACLAAPLAQAWHAARLGTALLDRPPTRALVLGAGGIGLGCALVLRHLGIADLALAETNPRRHKAVRRAGIRLADPARATAAALVIEAAGTHAARAAASRLVAPGGAIVHIGALPEAEALHLGRIVRHGVARVGADTPSAEDFREALAALAAGALGPLDWIEERPLAEGWRAFRDLHAGRVGAARVVLRL